MLRRCGQQSISSRGCLQHSFKWRRMRLLRDEGEAYVRKLDAARVEVTAVRYNGMIHDWGLLNAISQVPGTRAALLHASEALKKYLA